MKEYPNVIPFQFHNPSITATHSSAHLFNGVTDYLFNTYKMMWELSGETCRYGGEGKKRVHVEPESHFLHFCMFTVGVFFRG